MNHTAQNSLKASAYLLGLSVEELINVLHNASKVQEISTASGCPFVLPVREGKEESAPTICVSNDNRGRIYFEGFTEPDYSNPNECKRAVEILKHSINYWQIDATYWHGMWEHELRRNEETRK